MKKIAIIANGSKDITYMHTKHLAEYLLGKAEVYMEKDMAMLGIDVNYTEYNELFKMAEIMIVLGGDGTILQVATACAKNSIPVIGINLGRVGFITEIEVDNMKKAVDAILNDEYSIENRMLLKVKIMRGDKQIESHALNDVVVSKGGRAKLIHTNMFSDDEMVADYIADGLIIATPTGSTGYSISAGGPVVDPSMQLFVATPICPHMLSARSAVLGADKEITVRLDSDYRGNEAEVCCDGDIVAPINSGDTVKITKSKYEFKMIKIGGYSFYDTLIRKLS